MVLLGYRRYDSRLVFSIQLITPLSPSLTHSLSPHPLSLSYSLSLLTLSLSLSSQNADELKWRSGPISGRVSASLMMTKSGQLYHLMGQLNADEMAKDSPQLTKQLLKKFRKGFPTDWTDLLRGRGSSCAVVKKTKPPVK